MHNMLFLEVKILPECLEGEILLHVVERGINLALQGGHFARNS